MKGEFNHPLTVCQCCYTESMIKSLLKLCVVVCSLALVLVATPPAMAWEMHKGGDINLGPKDVLTGSQLVVGSNLTINTKIDGDLICAGKDINITGEVTGDVLCAGQSLTLSGKVGGNIRVAGQTVTVNGAVSRNANLFGQTLTLGEKSVVMGELFTAGSDVTVNGKVLKTWAASAHNLTVNGSVADTKFMNDNLSIGKSAVVAGKLSYQSENDAMIATGSKLMKGSEKLAPESKVTAKANQNFWRMPSGAAKGFYWGSKFSELIFGVLFGLIIVSLFSKWLEKSVGIAIKKMGKSLLWGVIVIAVAPVLLVMMVMTIIGIPLALVFGALLLLWCGLAHVTASAMIGTKLMAKQTLMWRWLIGYIVLWVLSLIPVVGWLVVFVAVLTGTGAVKMSLWHKEK